MSLASPPPRRASRPQPTAPEGLKVNAYNKASSLLVTLLLMIGLAVAFLIIIWLSMQTSKEETAVPVKPYKLGGGTPDGLPDHALKGEITDEIAKETDLQEPNIQTVMEMVTSAIATKVADLDLPIKKSDDESGGKSGGQGGTDDVAGLGNGPGAGDGSPVWNILGDNLTMADYARLLDVNEVELAAIGDGQIQYVSNLSADKPTVRTTNGQGEERQYLSALSGNLRNFDLALLQKAGIDIRRKIVVLFMPDPFLVKLQTAELGFNKLDSPARIIKTTFTIIKRGQDFEFQVLEQDLR